jgi:hypothetical protein
MNEPISIIIPIPTIVIQLPLPQSQYIIHQNAPCVYCGQHNQSHANDKEEEKKENNDVIYIKKEEFDVPEILTDIKSDELLAYFDVDERVSNHDVNMYSNMYSPISFTDTLKEEEEERELSFDEIHDQFVDDIMKTYFDDISQFVDYLKEDTSFM